MALSPPGSRTGRMDPTLVKEERSPVKHSPPQIFPSVPSPVPSQIMPKQGVSSRCPPYRMPCEPSGAGLSEGEPAFLRRHGALPGLTDNRDGDRRHTGKVSDETAFHRSAVFWYNVQMFPHFSDPRYTGSEIHGIPCPERRTPSVLLPGQKYLRHPAGYSAGGGA